MITQTTEKRRRAERDGRKAEILTLWIYRLQGYRCLCKRCKTPSGEIDLLMQRGSRILVLEVKFRQHDKLPAELSLPGNTQRQRIRDAASWLIPRLRLSQSIRIELRIILWTGWFRFELYEM